VSGPVDPTSRSDCVIILGAFNRLTGVLLRFCRHDERVKKLLDFTIYLDISDEIKRAWKIQRDMAERGWTLEQVEVRTVAINHCSYDLCRTPYGAAGHSMHGPI
jgi:hypothetical protein